MDTAGVDTWRGRRSIEDDGKVRSGDDKVVFTTRIGTPIEPRNLNRHYYRLRDKASVPTIRFHDLRHSCASLLYSQGVKLENISDVLGHSSPTITKKIHINVTDKVHRDAVERLDFLFDDEDDG